MPQQSLEVEVALVVCSPRPLAVRERLAGLASLPGFRLRGRPALSIRDTYLDTPDRALGANGTALRVRAVDGAALLTYKAQVRRTTAGTERVELEAPWSPAALEAVLGRLAADGVRLATPEPLERAGGADPLRSLLGLGLEVVQTRATERIPRDVVPEGGPARPVAELAVDAVAYHLPGGVARLHEVEVEAKGTGDLTTVGRVAAGLRERFGDELAPWPHGKLVTGQAVEVLLAAGRLDGLRDPDGTLHPAAYEVVAAHLRTTGRPDG